MCLRCFNESWAFVDGDPSKADLAMVALHISVPSVEAT